MKISVFIVIFGLLFTKYGHINNYELTTSYNRIVSLAPSMTETIRALNQHHKLVGITTQCDDQDLSAAKIGSFAEPNLEAILKQKPDLVLAVPHVMAIKIIEQLHENNIDVFYHQPDSIKDIKYITTKIGELLNVKHQANEINNNIDISMKNHDIFYTNKNSLIVVGVDPLVVAGVNTFAGQILSAMGYNNQVIYDHISWPIWPLENLLAHPPSLIILTNPADEALLKDKLNKLGINNSINIISPNRMIFNSPSPLIIKDINYLKSLLIK